MSSLELDEYAEREPHTKRGKLVRLLDPAFGFFVFAAHLLLIYIAAALACVLGLGTAGSSTQSGFLWALGLVTLASAALVTGHAVWRFRELRIVADARFRMAMTIGSDAIATVAILFQFFPILLVPLCA